MSANTDTTPENGVQGEYDLDELIESARAKVAQWDARVEDWRARNGDKPIPVDAFKEHPAAEMLMLILIPDPRFPLFIEDEALERVALALFATNQQLRAGISYHEQIAAQLIDSASLSASPYAAFLQARQYGLLARLCHAVLTCRTADDWMGLSPEVIIPYIRTRTVDVREGGDA